ncbi:hypothetical protein ABIB35_002499 [Arthrobacter sp. UYP6]|uniref:cache domain-containing protein n=1 Tax=Arthrobacter sp. UYP6 TaxID=1756378 RepID=UPI003396D2BD
MTSPGTRTTDAALRTTRGVSEFFDGVFRRLDTWRAAMEAGASPDPAGLDALVYPLVEPELTGESPLLIGAGFIAAPDYVRGRRLHFSWWLGPLDSNPLFGTTRVPTRLDLSAREYVDYLNDFRTLEWYSVPESTHQRHVTGPYVDHLCTCDYILTLTMPVQVDGAMIGVVGADVSVKRTEAALLPLLESLDVPSALISRVGRVLVSTDPNLTVGSLVPPVPGSDPAEPGLPCPGTTFFLDLRK